MKNLIFTLALIALGTPAVAQKKADAPSKPASFEEIRKKWDAAAEDKMARSTILFELAEMMAVDPKDPEPMLLAGDFYLDLEDYKMAEMQANVIISMNKDKAVLSRAQRLLGLTYESTNRINDAIAAYRESANLTKAGTPERSDALVYLGVALGAAEKHAEAEKVLREAVAADAKNGSAHGELGNALARQEKNKEAADCYRKAIELNPDDEGAKGNLQIVLERIKG